jgi:predicted nucleic acid-binding protein
VNAIVVDTSIWVEFFRGRTLPHLERALGDGDVVLSPIVAAELTSAPLTGTEQRRLADFLRDLSPSSQRQRPG